MFHIPEVIEYAISNVFALEQTAFHAGFSGKFQDLGIYLLFNVDFSGICKSNVELFRGRMYKTNLY